MELEQAKVEKSLTATKLVHIAISKCSLLRANSSVYVCLMVMLQMSYDIDCDFDEGWNTEQMTDTR